MSNQHSRLRITLRSLCFVAVAALTACAACDRKDKQPSEPTQRESESDPRPIESAGTETTAAPSAGPGSFVVPKVEVFGVKDEARARLAQAYDEAVRNPDDSDKIGALGASYLFCDSPVAAVACFTHATELAPEAVHWWYFLALSAERIYKKDLAIKAYENTISRKPDYVPAYIRLADLLVEKEPGKAESLYARVVELSKDMPLAHFGLARCAEIQGRSEDAIRHYRKAVELAPEFADAHAALVTLLTDAGRSVEAQPHIIARDEGRQTPILADPLLMQLFSNAGGHQLQEMTPADEAKRLISEGKNDQAIDLLRTHLQTHPEDTAARNAYAIALVGQDKAEQAAEQFELLLEAEPDNLFGRSNLGKLHMQANRFNEALSVFDEILSRDADNVSARQLRATCQLLLGHAERALPEFQAIAAQDPGGAGPSLNLAIAFVCLGRFDEAITRYQDFVDSLPDNEEKVDPIRIFTNELLQIIISQKQLTTDKSTVLLKPKDMILFADALLAADMKPESEIVRTYPQALAADSFSLAQAGRFDEALAYINRFAPADMGGVLLSTKGAILGMAGKPKEAADTFRKALTINPDLLSAKAGLGQALAGTGQPEEAIHLLREVIEQAPSDLQSKQALAVLLARQGNLEQAVAIAQQTVESQPENPAFRVLLGECFMSLDNYTAAIEHLRKAVAIQPANIRARHLLGMALQRSGNKIDAKQQFHAAIDAAPSFIDPVIALTGLEVSDKNFAGALKVLETSLGHTPESPLVINAMAWLLATCRDDAFRDGVKAVRLAEKACQITNQKAPEFLDTLAAAYAEAGRFEDAVATQRRAIQVAMEAKLLEAAENFKQRLELYEAGKPYRAD